MNPNALRAELSRRPFQPFTIRLADGRMVPVPHPEVIAVGNRRVIVVDPETEMYTVLEPLLIVSLESTGTPPTIQSQSNGGYSDGGPLSPVGS
jgi:hypothetical protein